MANGFVLTAQVVTATPTNLDQVVSTIKSRLNNISASVKIKFDGATQASLNATQQKLKGISGSLLEVANNARLANTSIAGLSKSLGIANINSRNLSQSVTTTNNAIRAQNSQSRILSENFRRTAQSTQIAANSMEGFGRQAGLALRRFAAYTTATAGFISFVGALGKSVHEAIEFQGQLIKLAQITGDSTINIEKLGKTVSELSTQLGVPSKSLIQVANTLSQAGFKAKDARYALEALAQTELAPTFDNITDTTEALIAVTRQFNIEAKDLSKTFGSINAVAAAFAVESSDITTAIQKAGGTFSSAGGKLNELLALFTSVRQTTRESADIIANGFNTIFARIQRPKTIEALRELGVELTDINGKFVGPLEAIKRLHEAFGTLGKGDIKLASIAELLGGYRQLKNVFPLLQQTRVAQAALNVAEAGQNSLAKDAAKAQEQIAVKLAKVREEFNALVREVVISKPFGILVDQATQFAHALIEVGKAATPLIPFLSTLGALKLAGSVSGFAKGFGTTLGGKAGFYGYAGTTSQGGAKTTSYPSNSPPKIASDEAVKSRKLLERILAELQLDHRGGGSTRTTGTISASRTRSSIALPPDEVHSALNASIIKSNAPFRHSALNASIINSNAPIPFVQPSGAYGPSKIYYQRQQVIQRRSQRNNLNKALIPAALVAPYLGSQLGAGFEDFGNTLGLGAGVLAATGGLDSSSLLPGRGSLGVRAQRILNRSGRLGLAKTALTRNSGKIGITTALGGSLVGGTGGGILEGAGLGASLGGLTGNPVGIGLGAAAGAIGGFVISLNKAKEAIDNANFDKLTVNLEKFFILSPGAGNPQELKKNLAELQTRAFSTTGEKREVAQNVLSNTYQSIVQFNTNLASISDSFDDFKRKGGLVSLQFEADYTGKSLKDLSDDIQKSINEQKHKLETDRKILEEDGKLAQQLSYASSLIGALKDAADSADYLGDAFDHILNSVGGGGAAKFTGKAGLQDVFKRNNVSNFPQFEAAANQAGNLLGGNVGKGIAQDAVAITKFTHQLPQLLREFASGVQNGAIDQNTSVQDFLRSKGGKNIPGFERIGLALEQKTSGPEKQAGFLADIRTNADKVVKEVLNETGLNFSSDVLEAFVTQYTSQINQYLGRLHSIQELELKARQKSVENISLSFERSKQLRATNPDDLGPSLAEFDFNRRLQQREILGQNANLAGNVPGIIKAIEDKRNQVEFANKNLQENPSDAAAKALSELTGELKSLEDALDHATDVNERVALINDKLSRTRAARQQVGSAATEFAFGDETKRRQIERESLLGVIAANKGVGALPGRLRESALAGLSRFSNVRSKAFGTRLDENGKEVGLTGEEAIRKASVDFAKKLGIQDAEAVGGVTPGEAESHLIEELRKTFADEEKNRKLATDALKALPNDLSAKLDTTFQKFIDDFRKNIENERKANIQTQIDQAKIALGEKGSLKDNLSGLLSENSNNKIALSHALPIRDANQKIKAANKGLDITQTHEVRDANGTLVDIESNLRGSLGLKPLTQRYVNNDQAIDQVKDLVNGFQQKTGIKGISLTDVTGKLSDRGILGKNHIETDVIDFAVSNILKEISSKSKGEGEEELRNANLGLKDLNSEVSAFAKKLGEMNATDFSQASKSINELGELTIPRLTSAIEDLEEKIRSLEGALGDKSGGDVPLAKAGGGTIFSPRGTDTVPAMLTPGEFVVNADSAKKNRGLLEEINSGTNYLAYGGLAERKIRREIYLAGKQFRRDNYFAEKRRRRGDESPANNVYDLFTSGSRSDRQAYYIRKQKERERRRESAEASRLNRPHDIAVAKQRRDEARKQLAERNFLNRGLDPEFQRRHFVPSHSFEEIVASNNRRISDRNANIAARKRKAVGREVVGFAKGGTVPGYASGGSVSSGGGGFSEEARQAMSQLSASIAQFTQTGSELAKAMSAFPKTLEITGTHRVDVIINGAEALKGLEPMLQDVIQTQVSKALESYQKKTMPQSSSYAPG